MQIKNYKNEDLLDEFMRVKGFRSYAQVGKYFNISPQAVSKWSTSQISHKFKAIIKKEIQKTTTIDKGDKEMEYAVKLIKAQDELIKEKENVVSLLSEINRLKNKLDKKSKNIKNFADFTLTQQYIRVTDVDFKEKSTIEKSNVKFSIRMKTKIEGDYSGTGYTKKEWESFTTEDFIQLFHKDDVLHADNDAKLLMNTVNDHVTLKGIRTLLSKKGGWKTYECTFHWTRANDKERHNEDWDCISYWKELTINN